MMMTDVELWGVLSDHSDEELSRLLDLLQVWDAMRAVVVATINVSDTDGE